MQLLTYLVRLEVIKTTTSFAAHNIKKIPWNQCQHVYLQVTLEDARIISNIRDLTYDDTNRGTKKGRND